LTYYRNSYGISAPRTAVPNFQRVGNPTDFGKYLSIVI